MFCVFLIGLWQRKCNFILLGGGLNKLIVGITYLLDNLVILEQNKTLFNK